MYYKKKINKKGQVRFEVIDRYKDPLTGKLKTVSVSYYKDTTKARRQAERDLVDKIDEILLKRECIYDVSKIATFGDLKNDWLANWSVSVKTQTVKREQLVLKRLGDIIGDNYLLSKITPLLIKNTLEEYVNEYNTSQATLQHIKSSLNKVFNHGVLYGVIKYSPMSAVKVDVSIQRKKEIRIKREKKFLEIHELVAFFNELSKRRNANYYDLAIFLLFTGLRIGEAAAITLEDIDFQERVVDVNKSLQYHDLRVSEFYFDETKTYNSERKVIMPQVAFEALNRVIERGRKFDEYADKYPAKSYRKSESVFRTEYGAPITSHSFREVLYRVEKDLLEKSKDKYGFEWKKHVVPHSFRHMHITYLQSGDLDVALREIMGRVGHINVETTMIYTHRTTQSQEKLIHALDKFAESSGFNFTSFKSWRCKYSKSINDLIEGNLDKKFIKLSLNDFRSRIGIKESYSPRHITANIIPKVEKDLLQYFDDFEIKIVRDGKKVWGYELSWS